MRHADLIRVPKALRGPVLTAGRQGRRRSRSLRDRSSKSVNQLDALGGSTWLVSLSLLALFTSPIGTLLRSVSRTHTTALDVRS